MAFVFHCSSFVQNRALPCRPPSILSKWYQFVSFAGAKVDIYFWTIRHEMKNISFWQFLFPGVFRPKRCCSLFRIISERYFLHFWTPIGHQNISFCNSSCSWHFLPGFALIADSQSHNRPGVRFSAAACSHRLKEDFRNHLPIFRGEDCDLLRQFCLPACATRFPDCEHFTEIPPRSMKKKKCKRLAFYCTNQRFWLY